MGRRRTYTSSDSGLTLIELILVIVLIGVLGSAAVSGVSGIGGWRQSSSVRKFAATWEFLFQEAFARGNAYRLVIDLEENAYYVRREILEINNAAIQVDYLENLRTKGEQKRRAEEQEQEELKTADEEFSAEDARDDAPLDELFYRSLYSDPHGNIKLTRPLAFPGLAEKKYLPYGLTFDRVVSRRGEDSDGRAFVRFSPRGASDYAVVYLKTIDEQFFTVYLHPATGALNVKNGEHEFNWDVRKADEVFN